jgi:hypothetical protein
VIVPIPYVHVGLGLVISAVSMPLIMRRVPMNHLYGVRLRKAFISERNWYELNAYGGKWLLAFGVFLVLFGFLARDLAPDPRSPWAPAFLVAPLLALVPVLIMINAFSGRLPDR